MVTYKENGGVSDKDFIKEHDLKKKGAAEKEEKKEKVEEKPVAVESMLKTGHSYIDKRCARLFGKRLVLGTIVGWLPACKLEDVGALFRVVHDDGDEEDLEEEEAAEAVEDYEALKPREAKWLKAGHKFLGKQVVRYFDVDGEREKVIGTIIKWLPADAGEGDPALWKCEHDDGDVEELDEGECVEGIKEYERTELKSKGNETWLTEGHMFIGRRILRTFEDRETTTLGTVIKWLAANEETGDPTLFRAVHDDGAPPAARKLPLHLPFSHSPFPLPPPILYTTGDEEDLEEFEVERRRSRPSTRRRTR